MIYGTVEMKIEKPTKLMEDRESRTCFSTFNCLFSEKRDVVFSGTASDIQEYVKKNILPEYVHNYFFTSNLFEYHWRLVTAHELHEITE